MRSHARASSAGSTMRQANGLGRIFRGAGATRGGSGCADGSRAPSVSIRLALLGCAAALLASLLVTPAQAAPVTIAKEGQGAGKVESPEGVAVDPSSGDVYFADDAHHSVSKFTSSGQFIYIVGRNVNKTKEANPSATQAEKNICTAASGDTCGIAEPGVGQDEFSASEKPIVVDAAGSVWVGDTNRVVQLDSSGAFVSEVPIAAAGATQALAIDPVSGDFYAISASLDGVRRYTPSGSPVNTLTLSDTLDAGEEPQALGVDGSGNVYVSGCGPISASVCAEPWNIKVFDPAGEKVSQFGAGQVSINEFGFRGPHGNALAVDDSIGALYVANRTDVKRFSVPEPGPLPQNEHVTDVLRTSATLVADLNPEGHEATYHFEYGTTASYGSSTPTQTLPGSEFDEEEVTASIENLAPGTTYHFRLVATNHCNDAQPSEECTVAGEDATFTTLPVAVFDAQWSTEVSGTAAVLNAELNPLGTSGSWWIEYGATEAYGLQTPLGSLPGSPGDVPVQTLVEHLLPGTVYHYHFVVENAFGTIGGPDRTFNTQVGGLGFELTDDRAWEMVSPPDKHGGSLVMALRGIQAAEDGSRLTYPSFASIEEAPEGGRAVETSQVLSRRGEGGAWASKDISLPQQKVIGFNFDAEYLLFSTDLSRALVQPRDGTPLSPEASESTPYLRESSEPPTFTPLVSGKEGFANVPPGTEFGDKVHVLGTNPSLTDIVLSSAVPLSAGETGPYLWSDGQIQALGGGQLGSGDGSTRNAISTDGSRIFLATANYGLTGITPGGLFLVAPQSEEKVRLDVAQPGASGLGAEKPAFQGASADGTVVFFTDSQRLTEDASPEGRDLYRCEIPAGPVAGGCATLTDLSLAAGESAMVKDIAPAISEDGSRIYFVAEGVLDSQPNGAGDSAQAGEPNLYLAEAGVGVRFIATLSQGDRSTWGAAATGGAGFTGQTSAAGSPSGRYLAFMSERPLSGYDNLETKSEEPTEQAYRYDAESDELVCVSCNPTGARPAAQLIVQPVSAAQKIDRQNFWTERLVGATLPEPNVDFGKELLRPRTVLDNGRVFFNAFDGLVAGDSNGQWDVYQYESSGVGDCTASSSGASVSRSAGGCVSLISSGTGSKEAAFIDASASGDDVFFLTPASLSVTDEDQAYDAYDARVDGIPAVLHPVAECLGEACQAATQAPNDPTPASASFEGTGNVVSARCAKGKVRKVRSDGSLGCVAKKKHRKKHAHKARRAAGKRRAGR